MSRDRFIRTFHRRKLFLDQLEVGNSISFAAEAAGGSVSDFKAWKKADPNFAADWDEAIESGTDFIEDIATQRAMQKSDPLMLAILKARRPEKYDRGGKLELSGGISVEGAKTKLLNKLARLAAQGQVADGSGESELQVPEEEDAPVLALPAPADPSELRGRKRRAAAEGSGRKKAA